jgi:hypothetical protein
MVETGFTTGHSTDAREATQMPRRWRSSIEAVSKPAGSPLRSGNAGRFVAARLGSQLRWHFRVTPKSATQDPADDVNDPEGEHGCKQTGCHDKPILRL